MPATHRHPFPVAARFERVVALSFAFPEALLRPLVPAGLEVDTYHGYGFLTAAMVWTKNLRPAWLPAFLGQDFFLAGYRIFTRLRDEDGRSLRGLHILYSETDKRRMVRLGNMMTAYRYRHIRIQSELSGGETHIAATRSDGSPAFAIRFDTQSSPQAPPPGSPFEDHRTARRFAGPMPFTFSALGNGSFLAIEGRRDTWKPRPIGVNDWQIALFDEAPFRGTEPILANAFAVEDISYRWDRGRIIKPGNQT